MTWQSDGLTVWWSDSLWQSDDLAGDGLVGVEEYRVDCCSRQAYSDIKEIDDAYNKLCSVSLLRTQGQ